MGALVGWTGCRYIHKSCIFLRPTLRSERELNLSFPLSTGKERPSGLEWEMPRILYVLCRAETAARYQSPGI